MTRVLKLAATSCLCKQWRPQRGDLDNSPLLLTGFGQWRISARRGVVTLGTDALRKPCAPTNWLYFQMFRSVV